MKPKYTEGDIVFMAEFAYLNQKHQRYRHGAKEELCSLRVKIIRTVVKDVLRWKKQAGGPTYRCLGDEEYPEFKLYPTIYDALESFPVGEPVLYVWKNSVPVNMNRLKQNIMKPIEWSNELSLNEVHATMEH